MVCSPIAILTTGHQVAVNLVLHGSETPLYLNICLSLISVDTLAKLVTSV